MFAQVQPFPAFKEARRRTALASAAAVGLGLLFAVKAHAWGFEDVSKLARQKAAAPFPTATKQIPAELANLDYDEYRDIRYNRNAPLWRSNRLPFEANFFHVGRDVASIRIHEITGGVARPIRYNPADFDFGKNELSLQGWGDLGYGGLRLFSHVNTPDIKDEITVFQGSSYFRALGTGQRYGLSARGLALDTTGPKEEFPRFTEFWLERPSPDSKTVTVHALMESERVTGAYRFDITPGERTTTEVRARLFMRPGVAPVRTLGLAPLTSMFFFGENQPRSGDFRPEVHDADGLMMATAEGEWLWRPLQNPGSPLATSFAMKNPKGFGLMQRDRVYANYEDTEARYEMRPSAWVTPIGNWGAGRVELFQFPIPDESHDNVVAYWVPEKTPAPGDSIEIAYQISWQGKNQQLPPNGHVTQSRRGNGFVQAGRNGVVSTSQPIQFTLDFGGPALDDLPENAPVKAIASADANGRIVESLVYKNPATGHWRMTLRLQRAEPAKPVELRASLELNGNAISETWTNLITP
jgi:periplasmic glucans biosynthesis protein